MALKEFEHPYFIAGGEVGHPGKYELRADTSLMEAVEIAGGFTHEAKHSQVLLFRHVNDELVEARVFNLKKMLNEKKLGEASPIAAGRSGVCSAEFHLEDRAVYQQAFLKYVREFYTVLASDAGQSACPTKMQRAEKKCRHRQPCESWRWCCSGSGNCLPRSLE